MKISKKSENSWNNFITQPLVPDKNIKTFQVKINNTKDGSIFIGIGKSSIFGNNALDSSSAITYFCRDGRIFDRGTRRLNGIAITCNKKLSILIDW